MSNNWIDSVDEYEKITGVKLSENQRMIYSQGYTFAKIDMEEMIEEKDAEWNELLEWAQGLKCGNVHSCVFQDKMEQIKQGGES